MLSPSTPAPTPVPGSLLGIDWGTTHRRGYLLTPDGVCSQRFADNQGALACKGRFAQALESSLQDLTTPPDLVLMSGMVGSALGWQEVPYVGAEVALPDLRQHLARLQEAHTGAPRLMVPGYCVRNAQGQPDVMRGEETQLLGAWAMGHHSGWFVLPGTHSKWVQLQAGRVVQLRTYMTGELFDLLGKHGTLAAAAGSATQVWDDTAFALGLESERQGARQVSLSHQLFGCRARVVCGDLPGVSVQSYLSGLLIGAELHDILRSGDQALEDNPIRFIGTPALALHYRRATALLGLHLEVLDAEAAYLRALAWLQAGL